MDELFKNGASIILFALLACVGYLVWQVLELKKYIKTANPEGKKLQLLAYERLAVFAERAGLRNMITNAEAHNISQQIYVSKEVWQAITKLKDQNVYVINQLASMLPPQANSLDLSKRILEYSLAQNTELNTVVLDAIQHEAKQVMKEIEG
jgi:hypothetical protein